MNIEEIKLITDMLTTIGATGKEAFIWFLIMKYGISAALWLVLFPTTMYTLYKIAHMVIGEDFREARLQTIRDLVLPNRHSGPMVSSEYTAVIAEINRLKNEAKK